MKPLHPSDGSDERARELEVTIRIAADGRVFVHDITPDLVPVVLAMNPAEETIRRKLAAASDSPSEAAQ